MSGADRVLLRQQARTALQAAPVLLGYTEFWAWSQSVDGKALPGWAVATPREVRERVAQDQAQDSLTLAVIVKRTGGDDLEDLMDADADRIETALVPAMRSAARDCELATTDMRLDGEGARRVATLTLTFTVTTWVADPA